MKKIKKSYAESKYGIYCVQMYYDAIDLKEHKYRYEYQQKRLANGLPVDYPDFILVPIAPECIIKKIKGEDYLNADVIAKLDQELKNSIVGWIDVKEAMSISGFSRQGIENSWTIEFAIRRYRGRTYYNPQQMADMKKSILIKDQSLFLYGGKSLYSFVKSAINSRLIRHDISFKDCLAAHSGVNSYRDQDERIYVKAKVIEKLDKLIQQRLKELVITGK